MNVSLRSTFLLLVFCLSFFPRCSCGELTAYTQLTPALILLNPTEIDFGPVPVDSFVSGKFTILNEGQLPLNITGFTLEPADAPFATELSAVMVERESSVDIVIHFRPTQEGIFEASLEHI